MAGRSTPGKTPSTYIPMAMAAPVFPADTSASHSPDLELGGHPERRVALAPEGMRGRLRHPHHLGGVPDGDGQLLRLEPDDLALDGGLVADEHRGEPELAGCRDGALDHDGGTEVAAHGVYRDLHRPRLSVVEATRPRSR